MDSITLYFREGSSDKVYQAIIQPQGGGHMVHFAYGRRGSTLTTSTKTTSPVDYQTAKSIFDKLVREKTANLLLVIFTVFVGALFLYLYTNSPLRERVESKLFDIRARLAPTASDASALAVSTNHGPWWLLTRNCTMAKLRPPTRHAGQTSSIARQPAIAATSP